MNRRKTFSNSGKEGRSFFYFPQQMQRDEIELDSVEVLFNKYYEFKPLDPHFALPLNAAEYFSNQIYRVPELQALKEKLNRIKCELDYVNLTHWSKHTDFTSRSRDIVYKIREQIHPEICTIAWAKLYEILHRYREQILPSDPNTDHGATLDTTDSTAQSQFRSLHLCEAPGAFISSTRHFLHAHRPDLPHTWLASTLNPWHESNTSGTMLSDDHVMIATFRHWIFGPEDSGNLLRSSTMNAIVEHVMREGHVTCVTADGSIDCSGVPEQQEHVTAPLHFSELLVALRVLRRGGALVLKLFTLFEHVTVSSLLLARVSFERLIVCKPSASKAGNSEVYLVGLNFRGLTQHVLDILVQFTERWSEVTCPHLTSHAMLSRDLIPDAFVEDLAACAEFFVEAQLRTITRNLALYGHRTPAINRHILADRHVIAQEWLRRYAPCTLPRDKRLIDHVTARCEEESCTGDWSRGEGSERELDTCHTGVWLHHVQYYTSPVHVMLEQHWPLMLHTLHCHVSPAVTRLLSREIDTWGAAVLGTRATDLHHSKFIDESLLIRKLSLRAALRMTRVKQVIAALPSPYQHSYLSVDAEKLAELLLGPLYALTTQPGHVLDLSRGRGGTLQALIAHTTMTRVTVLHSMLQRVDSDHVEYLEVDDTWSDTVTGVKQTLVRVSGLQCQLVVGNLSNKWHKQRYGVSHVIEYHMRHVSAEQYTHALEQITWSQLSAEICVALTCLTSGGTLVLQAWDVLLRPGAGLLHVLSRVFKHVHIIKLASSSPVTCECVWLCEHYLLTPDTVQPLIDHVLAVRARCEVESRNLLQLVPVPVMQLTRDALNSVNAQLTERECDALDQLLTLVNSCDTANDTCHMDTGNNDM